jgi:hypothetical protein
MMNSLKVLSLAGNQLPSVPPGLTVMADLQILDLHGNMISSIAASEFPEQETSTLRYLNLANNVIGEVGCGTFNAAPSILRLDMTANPTVCGFDPLTEQVHCECMEFSRGAFLGGDEGYCSNTCRVVPEPPTRSEGYVKTLNMAQSGPHVLALIQSFYTEPSFRYEVYRTGASSGDVDTSGPVASWSSSTILVVVVASIFLVAAIVFTVHTSRTSLRRYAAMPMSVSDDTASSYTHGMPKQGMQHYVSTSRKERDQHVNPAIYVSAPSEATMSDIGDGASVMSAV